MCIYNALSFYYNKDKLSGRLQVTEQNEKVLGGAI